MRTATWFLLTALGASCAFVACGGDEPATPGTGGGGGEGGAATTATTTTTAATTAATTATSVTATTSTGGTADCSGIFAEDDQCSTCLEGQCCPELAACDADSGCTGCLDTDDSTPCEETDTLIDLAGCLESACNTPDTCGDPEATACNPVTGAPCDIAGGETCDAVNSGGYICFPPPNDAGLCEPCSNAQGPFCGAGMACLNSQCVRYCCDDGDCGSGVCDTSLTDPEGGQPVGVCLMAGGGGGTGGTGGTGGAGGGGTGGAAATTGGTGGGAPAPTPACDAPETAPSNGTCYTIP